MSTARKVGILDHGSGNLHSAAQALRAAGADVVVTADPRLLRSTDALVVPGVGAFAACMAGIDAVGARELITDWVDSGRALLGICVGHQVLFEHGTEGGATTAGLAILAGDVEQLPARRLPHMGWNELNVPEGSRLFRGLERERFYFVHSFAALATGADAVIATATHDEACFVAAVETDNVTSTQFHPEKSGAAGGRLLRNWLASIG